MAAGATYYPIATTTVSGTSTTNITFSSISGSYTDLFLVINGGLTQTDNIVFQVNGDTGSNYSATTLDGNGTSAGSNRQSNASRFYFDQSGYPTANAFNLVLNVNFMNYSNTTTYKTILGRTGNAASGTAAGVALWRSTAAITSIKIASSVGSYTFISGTTATIYGITAA